MSEEDFEYPYAAFSNDELADSPPLKIGEMILCPHCNGAHVVEGGINQRTGEESDMLLFYNCAGTSYLAGVAGKNVMRRYMQ